MKKGVYKPNQPSKQPTNPSSTHSQSNPPTEATHLDAQVPTKHFASRVFNLHFWQMKLAFL